VFGCVYRFKHGVVQDEWILHLDRVYLTLESDKITEVIDEEANQIIEMHFMPCSPTCMGNGSAWTSSWPQATSRSKGNGPETGKHLRAVAAAHS
jgi:hypothetical protein